MSARRQRGMAVVLAILIVALAAGTSAVMLSQQDLRARQVMILGERAQAEAAARSGIEAMAHALAKNPGSADVEDIRTAAAAVAARVSVGAVVLTITHDDPQGRFNLNNLVQGDRPSEPDVRAFQEMLALAKLSPELAAAVVDAIDTDSDPTYPGGAEDLDYLAMTPPSRASNRPLVDPAHLVRIKGFDARSVERLLPFLTALPEPTSINLNSTPAEGLLALVRGLDLAGAGRLIAAREKAPFTDLAGFREQLPGGATLQPLVSVGTASRYVVVVSRARAGRAEAVYRALIGRKNAEKPGMIWRKQGDA
ncbi:MAG TPA: type II secretion system minor pseudopilin GspK [Burkholderiales bacterium]|nr:type II secretion system minor pseudopilin GspK [Burkholderiales bacterium]